jgi:hypothetical protein
MPLHRHSRLEGKHAMLSASQHAWIRYDLDKIEKQYLTAQAVARGTRLHELAASLIREGVTLAESTATLNAYVNDAIRFRMTPEQMLVYSENAFGTADAISFRDNCLRIHDLKTGLNEASFEQLEVYAAFYCLEYHELPFNIEIELRIYQNDTFKYNNKEVDPGLADKIMHIMEQIKLFDARISEMKAEEVS